MRKYFTDTKAYNRFRALGAKAPGPKRTAFYGVVYRAYREKQMAAADLPSYQLNSAEVQELWEQLSTNDHLYNGTD